MFRVTFPWSSWVFSRFGLVDLLRIQVAAIEAPLDIILFGGDVLSKDRWTRAAVLSESLIGLLFCSFELFVLHELPFHGTNMLQEFFKYNLNEGRGMDL